MVFRIKNAYVVIAVALVGLFVSPAKATFTDGGSTSGLGADPHTFTVSGHTIGVQIVGGSSISGPIVYLWDQTSSSPGLTYTVGNVSGTGVYGGTSATNTTGQTGSQRGTLTSPYWNNGNTPPITCTVTVNGVLQGTYGGGDPTSPSTNRYLTWSITNSTTATQQWGIFVYNSSGTSLDYALDPRTILPGTATFTINVLPTDTNEYLAAPADAAASIAKYGNLAGQVGTFTASDGATFPYVTDVVPMVGGGTPLGYSAGTTDVGAVTIPSGSGLNAQAMLDGAPTPTSASKIDSPAILAATSNTVTTSGTVSGSGTGTTGPGTGGASDTGLADNAAAINTGIAAAATNIDSTLATVANNVSGNVNNQLINNSKQEHNDLLAIIAQQSATPTVNTSLLAKDATLTATNSLVTTANTLIAATNSGLGTISSGIASLGTFVMAGTSFSSSSAMGSANSAIGALPTYTGITASVTGVGVTLPSDSLGVVVASTGTAPQFVMPALTFDPTGGLWSSASSILIAGRALVLIAMCVWFVKSSMVVIQQYAMSIIQTPNQSSVTGIEDFVPLVGQGKVLLSAAAVIAAFLIAFAALVALLDTALGGVGSSLGDLKTAVGGFDLSTLGAGLGLVNRFFPVAALCILGGVRALLPLAAIPIYSVAAGVSRMLTI